MISGSEENKRREENFFGKFPSRLPFGLSLIILGNSNGQGDISVEQFR
jgi:hypothetical protein